MDQVGSLIIIIIIIIIRCFLNLKYLIIFFVILASLKLHTYIWEYLSITYINTMNNDFTLLLNICEIKLTICTHSVNHIDVINNSMTLLINYKQN